MKDKEETRDTESVTEEVASVTESEDSSPETEVESTSSEETTSEETPSDKEEEVSSEESESDKSSLTDNSEKSVPFNKNPKFQERIQEIETKYGKKAQLWDTLIKLGNNDPEFLVEMTGKLEAAGELPKGTYEAARKQLDESELGKKDTNKPDELEQKISTLPEVQFARELMRKTQEEQATENLKLEKTLQDFEARHKDIPNSEKPSVIRKRIATLADGYVEEGMKYEDALEEAYNMLFNKDAVLAREREKGEVEGQIKAGIKSVTGTTVGSSSSNPQTLRKLTREEEEARALLGMSKEEYIKYKDSDGFVE